VSDLRVDRHANRPRRGRLSGLCDGHPGDGL